MPVLSREKDESIMIGDDVEIVIVDVKGGKVRLGINAPREVSVHRKEVWAEIKKEKEFNVGLLKTVEREFHFPKLAELRDEDVKAE